MQSTALALMACENTIHKDAYPQVPVYDAIIFCDLHSEPPWVYEQVTFIQCACRQCGIPFYVLHADLYGDYMEHFGWGRISSAPFWTLGESGKPGRLHRQCTLDYKIKKIQQFVKYDILHYRPGERIGPYDKGHHQMHMGFSAEERQRRFDSRHSLFVNCYPLIEMGWTRADTYRYTLERWGLDTKASACTFCPYHSNYFFQFLQTAHPETYQRTVDLDTVLDTRQGGSMLHSKIFISKSCKRIRELTPEECCDARCFEYRDRLIWDGF